MKRIDTLTEEAKAVYLKTLKTAKAYGRSEFECGILACDDCPFSVSHGKSCMDVRTEEEWIAWAAEEIEEEKVMNEEQYQNPLDIFNSSGNDSIKQMVYKYVATVCEAQDSIIESTIRKIGGTEFEKITIDRDKVIEALTMYRDKDQYEKIRHGRWIRKKPNLGAVWCSECDRAFDGDSNFCPNCGARMDEEEKQQ